MSRRRVEPATIGDALSAALDEEIFGVAFVDAGGHRVDPRRVLLSAGGTKTARGELVYRPARFTIDYASAATR